MAKHESGRKKKEETEGRAESYLEKAFRAFESGDMVRTRRLLDEATPHLGDAALEASARQLARKLFPVVASPRAYTPREVASELRSRTNVPLSSYGFALFALGVFLLMLWLALSRSL
jgi:hypothetical protein